MSLKGVMAVICVILFAACVEDRPDSPCLKYTDSLTAFAAWRDDISQAGCRVAKNKKIAHKVKGRGRMPSK